MGWVLRRIDNIRDGYAAIVRRLVRVAALGVVTILVSAAGIYLLSLRTPTGFLPEEDQGAFFISVQLPDLAAIAKLDNGSAAAAPTRAPDSPHPPMAPTAESTLKVAGERRHVTVMFCDLVDSTGIAAKLDAEEWRDLVGAYIDASSIAVTDMGGKVAKKLGDGLMALFGYPVAQENDAERAVRAALSIQRALAELNLKNEGTGKPALAARIAIDLGPVVIDAGGEIFGDIPNVAARAQSLAEPNAVVVTARVQRQIAGLFVVEERGTHELKGVPEPVTLFRIVRASGGGRLGNYSSRDNFAGPHHQWREPAHKRSLPNLGNKHRPRVHAPRCAWAISFLVCNKADLKKLLAVGLRRSLQ
jgi:class 3 adenylate cyclase